MVALRRGPQLATHTAVDAPLTPAPGRHMHEGVVM